MFEDVKMVVSLHTRAEINLRRLLEECEHLAAKAQQNGSKLEWRVEKFVEFLQKQLDEVSQNSSKADDDNIRSYKRRLEFLKGIIKSDKENSKESRWRVNQTLLPVTNTLSHPPGHRQLEPTDTARNLQFQTRGRIQKDSRSELLGGGSSTRRRMISQGNASTEENIDEILKHHQEVQEKVAEEMIKMAQSLKHTSLAASDIIQEDKRALQKSTSLAEANREKLKRESERLEEMNKRKCSWWIWIMLILVCIVFLLMVLFIKFVPKRTR